MQRINLDGVLPCRVQSNGPAVHGWAIVTYTNGWVYAMSFRILLNLILAWRRPKRTNAWVDSMLLNSKWVGFIGKKAVLAFFLILFVSKVFVLSV